MENESRKISSRRGDNEDRIERPSGSVETTYENRCCAHRVSKPIEKTEKTTSIKNLVVQKVPILQWFPKYKKTDLISDFIAGLTVGLTMMPQSIAYANLAGLPAQYGLYTAFVGSFTYVLFGTIKEVSIGPTSLMALLTFSYTEKLPVDYVILLTLLAGCVELLMGVLKLGFFVDFISPCVTSGFTSAMSVAIAVSQLKNLLGLRKLDNHGIFDVLWKILTRYREIKIADASLGLGCIVFLFCFKQLPKIKTKNRSLRKAFWFLSISKNALVVLLTSILAYCLCQYCGGSPFNLSGDVPQGMPSVKVPGFSTQLGNNTVEFVDMVKTLGSGILVVPIAAVLANVAIAKAFASGVVVDTTQEMVTLGLCNILGSFVQAMPSCGAFTRSAVASSSGVKTPLQGIYSGTIILLALSFLTPYFYYIPRSTLAAVLISAIITMFDYAIFPKLWKNNRFDFFLTLATLIIGIIYGVEMGIICGGILNLMILLKIWTRPKVSKEIRTDHAGNNYIYIKPEIGLYYPSVDYLTTIVAETHSTAPDLPIVIDCKNWLRIDYAGCLMINNLIKTYNNKHAILTLVNVQPEILRKLNRMINLDGVNVSQIQDDSVCKVNGDLCLGDGKIQQNGGSDTPLLISGCSKRKLSQCDNV